MGSPSIIKSPFFNIAFMLVTMQLTKRIDWDGPNTLLYARIGYLCAQALVIGLAYMLIFIVQKKNDTTPLRFTPPPTPGQAEPQPVSTTNVEYDVAQIKQFIKSTFSSILMIGAMHYYFKFTQPLVLQSVMPLKNLITHKVALIHLWGDAAEGDLKRPFKAENPFAALMGGSTNATSAEEPAAADNHAKTE